MTRDQAQRIANDIFDAAESAGHLSKDLVADAIFNSWHKQTADNRKWVAYEVIRNACATLGGASAAQYLDGAMLANALIAAGDHEEVVQGVPFTKFYGDSIEDELNKILAANRKR